MKSNLFSILLFLVGIPCIFHGIDPWMTPPTTISTPIINSHNPQIALDANGNAAAVWIENQVVVSRRCPLDGDWDKIAVLSATTSSNPQIVMDSDSTATAIWLENGMVYTTARTWKGDWSTPEVLSGKGATDCTIAINTKGNIVATWLEGGFVQTKIKPTGSPWPVSADVISASGAQEPDVSIGGNNNIVAVWVGSDLAVYSSNIAIGGSWSMPEQVSPATISTASPCVAVDEVGNAAAAWFSFEEMSGMFSEVNVQVSFWESNAWGSATTVSTTSPSTVDPHELQLCIRKLQSESAVVAWTSCFDGSYYNIEWATFQFNIWNPSMLLLSNATFSSFGLDIDWQGYAYIVGTYLVPFEGNIQLYGGCLNLSAPPDFLKYQWLFATEGNSYNNHIATIQVSPLGRGAMIWENWNGSTIAIQALIITIPQISPVTNLSVTQTIIDYGVFEQHNNQLNWTESLSTSVNKYLIFRNGVLIAKVPSGTVSYIDFNQGDESGTYSMIAESRFGLMSLPVEINFP